MKSRAILSLAAISAIGAAVAAGLAFAAPADRDPTFGRGGVVTHDVGPDSRFLDVAQTPDGAVISAGFARPVYAGPAGPTAFLTKHDATGALDEAFAARSPSPGTKWLGASGEEAAGVAVDALGRVLVVLESPNGNVYLGRMNAGGVLDESFGRGGFSARVAIADSVDVVGLGVRADGRPVVVANFSDTAPKFEVLQWAADGSGLDPTFDTDGRLTVSGIGGRSATDMLVDRSDGVVVAVNGYRDGRELRRFTTGAPGATLETPRAVETPGMAIALSGGSIVVAGAEQSGDNVVVRAARIRLDGLQDMAYGGGDGIASATLLNRNTPELRGIATLSDRRAVVAVRVDDRFATATGVPRRIGLTRFNADGTADETFNPALGSATGYDDLGSGRRVDPIAGIVRVGDDKVLAGGRTFSFDDNDDGGLDEAFLARYGSPGQAPTAKLLRRYRPFGDPPTTHDHARPGQPVDLDASGSTDPDGPIARYEWDLDGQPGFEVHAGATVSHAFGPGTHRVQLRVIDGTGQDDTTFANVEVKENLAPGVTVKAGADTLNPTQELRQFNEDRPIVFRAEGTDVDGAVVSYALDLDGEPGYEIQTRAAVKQYADPRTFEAGVKVTDNEGKTTEERFTITIVEPACSGARRLSIPGTNIRAFAECWRKDVSADGKTVTWKASDSPPPPLRHNLDGGPSATTMAEQNQLDLSGRATINGIVFTDYDFLHIVVKEGSPVTVSYGGARVETVSQSHVRLLIHDGAVDTWKLVDGAFTSVDARGRYNGLDVGELVGGKIELPSPGAGRLKFYPLLPAVLGGVSTDEVVTLAVGASATTAGAQASQAGADCIEASAASLPGLEFLENAADVTLCTANDTPGRWAVRAEVDLAEFVGPPFEGLPRVKLQAEVADGVLVAAAAAGTFPDPGISFAGPVFLTGLNFELLLDDAQFVKASCVPAVGEERRSLQGFRDYLIAGGLKADWVYANIPDFVLDHGHPSTALCGGLDFRVGISSELELARGKVGLGVASYPGSRPDAFRMLGTARILDLVDLQMQAGVYSNGYMDMRVEGYAEFIDLLSLRARFNMAVDVVRKQFNAEAFLEACVIPVELCAGIEALISNKGMGACLLLDVAGADWRPGAYVKWAGLKPGEGAIEAFFSGCDLGPIRVHFCGSVSTSIEPEFVPNPGARALRLGSLTPPAVTAQAKREQAITVPPGLKGTYFAVRGANGALPKFTVQGPRGERYLADGTASSAPDRTDARWILHDRKRGITHVLVVRPAGGVWKIVPQPGSAGIAEIRNADGTSRPKVVARVTGKGRKRVLTYKFATAPGQTVTFEERGPTGKQFLGKAKGGRGTLRFTAAAGEAERRQIVAVVMRGEQLVDEVTATTYRAPATTIPSKPRRLTLRRARTALYVGWKPVAGAESYLVTAKLSDGRVVKRVVRRARLRLAGIASSIRGTITVQGSNDVGQPGKTASVKLKPVEAKKKRGAARRRAR